jgi:catechol 2,3-dioxygenase-like lactoylglutathione lyase family enzyme
MRTLMASDFPVEGVEPTLLLVVSDVIRSRTFYTDVLGAELFREYAGDSAVLQFQGMWILLVSGGDPTPGKPTVTFAPPSDPDLVDHQLTLRVPDCRSAFEVLSGRGAEFLAPPVDRGGEIRAFFRDPDGHLLEISELT